MNTNPLKDALAPVIRRYQLGVLFLQCLWVWGIAAGISMACLALSKSAGIDWGVLPVVILGAASLTTLAVVVRWKRTAIRLSDIVFRIETTFPDLQGLLLTAVQPSATESDHFLQRRVRNQAVRHAAENDWCQTYPIGPIRMLGLSSAASLLLSLVAIALTGVETSLHPLPTIADGINGVDVSPGNVEIEKGQPLLVSARFHGAAPASAELVIVTNRAAGQRIALTRSLSDPVFGGGLTEVTDDFQYRIRFGNQQTADYRVHVFELPRLMRLDATFTFPEYSGLPIKRIEDTRRIVALEGTRVQLSLLLNHPVRSARLISRTNPAVEWTLSVQPNHPVATLDELRLTNSALYDLRLVDNEGRTNRIDSPLVFEALPNRRPEIHFTTPRGDLHPSPLEEISFSGTVWDDLGVISCGIGLSLVGKETEYREVAHGLAGQQKHPFQMLLALESLQVSPGDLVCWFGWADDLGPDGKPRRTTTDLHYAEIRPFDEIFRESKTPPGSSGESSPQAGGNASEKLAEIQKQIVSGTWKVRESSAAKSSPPETNQVAVLGESQSEALQRALVEKSRASSSQQKQRWQSVVSLMEQALKHLKDSSADAGELTPALRSEQAAYQALLAMAAREKEVARQKQSGSGKSQNKDASQRELDELDLSRAEKKYESERQAQSQSDPARKEMNEILERLKELARREEDLTERLKELQSALQAAATPEERRELQKQLKRLEEEQRQMVADADEVKQRMQQGENAASLSQESRRLESTRSEMQQAAQKTGQGELNQAIASGTRAQKELQQQRDDLRKQSSSQLKEELRQLRTDSRELVRRQEELKNQLQSLHSPDHPTLDTSGQKQAALDSLARQEASLTNLLGRARQLAQQAENQEPRVSQKLEDSLRRFEQDETATVKQVRQALLRDRKLTRSLDQKIQETESGTGAKTLELTTELARAGYLPEAGQTEKLAHTGIESLNQGFEQAASVAVGDDSETLRQASRELDAATDALQRELAQASPPSVSPTGPASKNSSDASSSPKPGGQPGSSPGTNPTPNAGHKGPGREVTDSGGTRGSANRTATGRATDDGGGGDGAQDYGNADGSRTTGSPPPPEGPLTGGRFAPWSDRLRNVEEMVDSPDLRNAVAGARERARSMRQEYKNNRQKPDWAKVQLQVLQPLVEVRNHLADELARRGSREALVPLDRDPIPARYSELVRHYYQELGKDR